MELQAAHCVPSTRSRGRSQRQALAHGPRDAGHDGLAMASGPRLRHGRSAGVFNASRQAGGALGVAVLGTTLTSGPGASVSLRRPFLLTAGAYGLPVALATAGPRGARESPDRQGPR